MKVLVIQYQRCLLEVRRTIPKAYDIITFKRRLSRSSGCFNFWCRKILSRTVIVKLSYFKKIPSKFFQFFFNVHRRKDR